MAKVTQRCSEEGMVICSFNCSGLNQSASYISDIIVKHEIDILCIQETWLLQSQVDRLKEKQREHLCGVHTAWKY